MKKSAAPLNITYCAEEDEEGNIKDEEIEENAKASARGEKALFPSFKPKNPFTFKLPPTPGPSAKKSLINLNSTCSPGYEKSKGRASETKPNKHYFESLLKGQDIAKKEIRPLSKAHISKTEEFHPPVIILKPSKQKSIVLKQGRCNIKPGMSPLVFLRQKKPESEETIAGGD